MLSDYIGKDATEAFETVGHTEHALELMKQFYVGDYFEVRTKNLIVFNIHVRLFYREERVLKVQNH